MVLCLAALAACGEAPASSAAPAGEPPALFGRYVAASDTARTLTGDLTIERAGLALSRGAILYTRVLAPRRGYDLISNGGDSYASLVVGRPDLNVELRRVTQQALSNGAVGLCGDETPTYVALVSGERPTSITLLVFVGAEPPGPEAIESRLCGAFAYDAPSGARTREGVVLHY